MNEGDTIPQLRLERIFEQFYGLVVLSGAATGEAGLSNFITANYRPKYGGHTCF